jgi:Protein of unknown function (DUF3168)
MIETDLFSVLSAAASITAITGANIFPVALPTKPILPALTYKFVGGTAKPTFGTGGVTRARVQIDAWGLRYLDAINLRAAVVEAMNGYIDQNMTVELIQTIDDFDYELLQFIAIAEFYIFFAQ